MKKLLLIVCFLFDIYSINVTADTHLKSLIDFVPNNYVVTEKIVRDLNKDGEEDYVYIVKGTKKSEIVYDLKHTEKVDRNRRGIVIIFKKNDKYKLIVKNIDCFFSENEDNGAYISPDMGVEVKKGILIITYFYGKYGHRDYKFRFQDYKFKLIGYDNYEAQDGVFKKITSINLLTKKMLIKNNVNPIDQEVDARFKETWKNLTTFDLINLSDIKNFDGLDTNRLISISSKK